MIMGEIDSVVDINAEELNDDLERQGSGLYREIRPDFDGAHRKALKARDWLKKKYFPKTDQKWR